MTVYSHGVWDYSKKLEIIDNMCRKFMSRFVIVWAEIVNVAKLIALVVLLTKTSSCTDWYRFTILE